MRLWRRRLQRRLFFFEQDVCLWSSNSHKWDRILMLKLGSYNAEENSSSLCSDTKKNSPELNTLVCRWSWLTGSWYLDRDCSVLQISAFHTCSATARFHLVAWGNFCGEWPFNTVNLPTPHTYCAIVLHLWTLSFSLSLLLLQSLIYWSSVNIANDISH